MKLIQAAIRTTLEAADVTFTNEDEPSVAPRKAAERIWAALKVE